MMSTFWRCHLSSLCVMLLVSCIAILPLRGTNLHLINASVSTDEVGEIGDAADDPAIWVHKSDPAQSLVIATDKKSGLVVFDLSGKMIQKIELGRLNNVDLRDGFLLGDRRISLVIAGNRTDNTLALFEVDEKARQLKRINTNRAIPAGLTIYGSCLYKNQAGEFYVFVNAKNGDVIQWRLQSTPSGEIVAQNVRHFNVGSQVEACVVDDENQNFYISEEDVGIWKYKAEPTAANDRISVDHVGAGGHLVADVEGLGIYKTPDGGGYLIASSQGENAYAVYERTDKHIFVNKFSITYGNGSDIVRNTDGLDVTSVNLSPTFPKGMLVVQDGWNGGRRQNFKLISWAEIERNFIPPDQTTRLRPR